MRGRGRAHPACSLLGMLLTTSAGVAGAQPLNLSATGRAPSPIDHPPAELNLTPPAAAQVVQPRPDDAAAPSIRTVRVLADYRGDDAIPIDAWMPPKEASGAVRLEHRLGQPLDAAWVQQQFAREMGSGGMRPSAAVALIQLINRAFVTAGFVNSGLLVASRPTTGGELDVRLVYGGLAVSDPKLVPVTVDWENHKSGGLSADYIRARFPSASRRPLNALELERDFRLLDESPEISSISAALRPGERPGEASLHLLVHPAQRFDFYGGVSNDRSPAVGERHIFAGTSGRNLLTSGDYLTLEGGVTRGAHDADMGYTAPLFATNLSLHVRAGFNNAAVVTSALIPLDIRARDRDAEAGLTYQLMSAPLMMRGRSERWSPSESLAAGLTFLARRQKSYLFGEPFSFAPGSVNGVAEYKAMRLSGDYVRRSLNNVVALSLGATIGLDGTRSDIPGVASPRDHFSAFLGQLDFAQRLGAGFELHGRVTAQHSLGTLYSGLRLAVGGVDSVRGYRESLFLVDRGIIGSLELSHAFDLSGERHREGFAWGSFSASAFADAAAFGNAEKPELPQHHIASVGVSLAWTPSDALRAEIAYGHALNRIDLPGNRSLQDRGIHFRVIVHPAQII